MNEEKTVIVHVPALVAVLLNAENGRGRPLTEAEVLDITETAEAMVVRPQDIPVLVETRGYEDIDPENVWREWQEFRRSTRDDKG